MEWFNAIPGIDEIDTAESFFDFFELPYDPSVIVAKRMHIMGDFHQRLAAIISVPLENIPEGEAGVTARDKAHWTLARHLLGLSYDHFLQGTLATQSGLAVYQRNNNKRYFIPLSSLTEVQS
ncbi:nitrogenase-stabilizing/protective protein NifW [Sodalis sp. dw_96]|uniref:nitrogenase-stabilizing/protective protein NifW n=1 Tax=Sodalis sp. dw_96 TaxID=2719794 RepID=UPI001BD64F7F|nr:nitrogenase-stabilizing/protective protein NifW [Sodalis sp. dw_96]